ncbi:hypothetical protein DTW90_10525 [Neorhizobium sp. P12A]|jgi:hypothetical protein|uniref:hypothetical protein n=1 Tax=Rhizobium/Agrobacterium group TaxID=227290 RepID=UPI0010446BB4|nr:MULTISPECIES: hypothetical protein [Rhizobium/Agrobacterium group]KAA0699773.1 hypothetical protein DTW90_10525 [Neorhizobium sp. P12A]TCR93417.1 hypothetical protein EV561_101865 [Rhizobium sp. BK376]
MSVPVSSLNDPTMESSSSAVSWGPIIAGALVAAVISLLLMLVGSGIGLTMISPFAHESSSAITVTASAAAWLIVVQWFSAGVGGYLTGRLRTKWTSVHTYEVFFRDTAHGFLSWALATLLVVGFLGSAISSLIGAGTQATASAIGAAGSAGTIAASAAASNNSGSGSSNFSTAYFTDALLRPANAKAAAPANESNEAVSAEVTRILVNGAAQGEISADDRTYLQQVVASRAGLSDADAKARVDAVLKRVDDAKAAAQKAADTARKAAAATALVGALALFVGAFIASVAAALGGRQRDEDEERYRLKR